MQKLDDIRSSETVLEADGIVKVLFAHSSARKGACSRDVISLFSTHPSTIIRGLN